MRRRRLVAQLLRHRPRQPRQLHRDDQRPAAEPRRPRRDCRHLHARCSPGTLDSTGSRSARAASIPPAVKTVADQLEAAGCSWRGYMQDMADSARQPATCRHPAIGAPDDTQPPSPATSTRPATTRSSTSTRSSTTPTCETQRRRPRRRCRATSRSGGDDARTTRSSSPTSAPTATTRPAPTGRQPGGFAGIDAFLQDVGAADPQARRPTRTAAADRHLRRGRGDGAERVLRRARAGRTPTNNGGADAGPGGGRVGAVMLSPCIAPGTVVARPPTTTTRCCAGWRTTSASRTSPTRPLRPSARSDQTSSTGRTARRRRASPSALAEPWPAAERSSASASSPTCRSAGEEATIRFAGRTLVTDANGEAIVRLRLRGRGRQDRGGRAGDLRPGDGDRLASRDGAAREARVGVGGAAPVG